MLWRYGLLLISGAAVAGHYATEGRWVEGTDTTPAFYTLAPRIAAPRIMSGDQLTGQFFTHPFQVTAYQMAARIDKVLYEQPCHCRCDRALRHKSLHSCFEGTHGAICGTCMREAIFAYQQTRLGKTPEEIHASIENGDWQHVSLDSAAL